MFDIILSKDLPDLIRMLFVAILFNHGHHLIRQYSVNYLGSKTDLHQLLDLLDLGMTTQINTHIVIDLLHKIDQILMVLIYITFHRISFHHHLIMFTVHVFRRLLNQVQHLSFMQHVVIVNIVVMFVRIVIKHVHILQVLAVQQYHELDYLVTHDLQMLVVPVQFEIYFKIEDQQLVKIGFLEINNPEIAGQILSYFLALFLIHESLVQYNLTINVQVRKVGFIIGEARTSHHLGLSQILAQLDYVVKNILGEFLEIVEHHHETQLSNSQEQVDHIFVIHPIIALYLNKVLSQYIADLFHSVLRVIRVYYDIAFKT